MTMPESSEIVVVGGGPAGMMAGLLFARAGIETLVLEKHKDFFRDFRGDTVHPSTMEVLAQLGMLDRFLQRPHHRFDEAVIVWNGKPYHMGDLSRLKTPAPFIAMMPQWDFLDFLRDEARAFPKFRLAMSAPVGGFLEEGGRIAGVVLADGRRIAARLVIMADGRDSLVRQQGLLPLENLGAPIDVFWFKVPKQGGVTGLRGAIRGAHMLVMIDRGDYWQCAWIIAKGAAEATRAGGIAAFREEVRATAGELPGLDEALPDWDAVKLLTVELSRLTCWHRPGLLAIGDAAHAMSPVGGIGINLAIQDAVAAANILAGPMASGRDIDPLLGAVQERRLRPTKVIQAGQKLAHERILRPVLSGRANADKAPMIVRLFERVPFLRRIPGRIVGLGYRRERLTAPYRP